MGRSEPGTTGGDQGQGRDDPARRPVEAAFIDGVPVVADLAEGLTANVGSVVRGKPEAVRLAVTALLAGGHLLVEDVPGVGKTLLAKALARSVGATFARIQATPDLLPTEITGTNVFSPRDGSWDFRPGPVFAHVLVVDEVNRATPRTQSALLEAMEERQVTVDGQTRPLPDPFFLVATQNPYEHAGTFPLLEGHRDRFAMVVHLGHPGREAEREMLLGTGGLEALGKLSPVTSPAGLGAAVAAVRRVHCAAAVADYVIDVAAATRAHPEVVTGASPRASLSLLDCAKATAAMAGRAFVVPDDVKAVAGAALAHRLILAAGPDMAAGARVVAAVLRGVAAPRP
ncbi:MAG: MoxR family ATPase [Acidimicrobiales bacterium]